MLQIPFEPYIFGHRVNIHLILEYLAFFIGFRYYLYLRKNQKDTISTSNRLSIIIGATVGAFLGSRIVGILENPSLQLSPQNILVLLNTKTIMGGLFGGLLGVELCKKIIGEKSSSGDLFTLPIIAGIFTGRIGCFLSGINEFTYGKSTDFFLAMDLGDQIPRHPLALYELIFLLFLFFVLKKHISARDLPDGTVFRIFMISYFSFRFGIEFLKPNVFFVAGLSTIQWLCLVCILYYYKTVFQLLHYAGKKVHLL